VFLPNFLLSHRKGGSLHFDGYGEEFSRNNPTSATIASVVTFPANHASADKRDRRT